MRQPFCVYVETALDRIEVAGPLTADAMRAEAAALRQAAEVLERRAATHPVCALAPEIPAGAGRVLL